MSRPALPLLLIYLISVLGAEEGFLFDRLSPYEEGVHGSRRSRREISLQQGTDWNDTYEEFQLDLSAPKTTQLDYQVHRYEDTVRSQMENALSVHRIRYLLGSIVHVSHPYHTFSVLEPQQPGGCQPNYFSTVRSTVSATSGKRGCKIATNAGYFSVSNGKCLGNIVSDGRIVQTSSEQNANFGIRHDGTIVVGYIPEEDILNGSFRQLVSGVIWLVRNGSNYVNESMHLESASNQNTGKMSTFVNVLSARTAVGHDSQGRIVFANVRKLHETMAAVFEYCCVFRWKVRLITEEPIFTSLPTCWWLTG